VKHGAEQNMGVGDYMIPDEEGAWCEAILRAQAEGRAARLKNGWVTLLPALCFNLLLFSPPRSLLFTLIGAVMTPITGGLIAVRYWRWKRAALALGTGAHE
jgi:hypothetical protein